MTDVHSAVLELLDDRPEFEDDLRELLEVDDAEGTWTFDDVPLDSGQFGEVVSRGIVEKRGDEYVVADRAAVEDALSDDPEDEPPESTPSDRVDLPTREDLGVDVDPRTAGLLAGALVLVIGFRITAFAGVFRGEDVVLLSNDPYYYRYWVDQFVASTSGPLDLGILSNFPGIVATGEPLLIASMWWIVELLGGGRTVGGWVLAWYPVVSAVVVGVLLYVFVLDLTEDRRVALASVVMLAVIPIHAFRTSLGYADHHAFDNVWIVLTAMALGFLVRRDRSLSHPKTLLGTGCLGVGIAGQVLAWEAGPLLMVVVGATVVVWLTSVLREEAVSPVAGAPIAAGVGMGAALVGGVHLLLGWHSTIVVASPILLFVGVCAALGGGVVVDRFDLHPGTIPAAGGVGVIAVVVLIRVVSPDAWAVLQQEGFRLFRSDAIAETSSVFDVVLGFVPGPVWWMGLVVLLAVPAAGMAAIWVYREYRHRWIVPLSYLLYIGALAALQRRFAGELAPFVAVFAGLGFVGLTAWVEATRDPMPAGDTPSTGPGSDLGSGTDSSAREITDLQWPGREKAAAVVFVWLLVSSVSLVALPATVAQATYDDGEYEAAMAARSYAADYDLGYPENRVLSRWDKYRMYNYFVNGESNSYGFARNNYVPFLNGEDGQIDRMGFVLVDADRRYVGLPRYDRLRRYGSRGQDGNGSGRFMAIWQSEDRLLILFRVVPGATLTGTVDPNATVTASTEVEIEGASFTYERQVRADENGSYAVTVAYPGEYQIGNATVTVEEDDVLNGTTVAVDHDGVDTMTTPDRSPSGSDRLERSADDSRAGARGTIATDAHSRSSLSARY